MKLKKTTLGALLLLGFCAALAPAQAQTTMKAPLALADTNARKGPEKVIRRETLSGIDLYEEKGKSKDFMLSFQQELVEGGVLTVANSAGKVLFTKNLMAGDHTLAPPMNLGVLRNGVYLVEVKTGNTIYWKKLRIKP